MPFTRHHLDTDDVVASAAACGTSTGPDELHVTVRLKRALKLDSELAALEEAYEEISRRSDFPRDSAAFRRVFVSDAANQLGPVERSRLGSASGDCAVSVVEQPPVGGPKLALWAYHVRGEHLPAPPGHCVVKRGHYLHAWSAGLHDDGKGDAYSQTRKVFEDYEGFLREQDATLEDDVIRTWLFVRDVDRKYAGMVRARRELFEQHGLTASSHFIASTGIEGRSASADHLVTMDAYALRGLRAGQLEFLHAPEHLGPTSDYGVTFERGVRVAFGDRAHLWISGTASINPQGETVHVGSVEKQLDRAMENTEALLTDGKGSAQDLAHMIVYLRDASDHGYVHDWLEERMPDVPRVMVHAPVCRPTWLVEIESAAWMEERHDAHEPF